MQNSSHSIPQHPSEVCVFPIEQERTDIQRFPPLSQIIINRDEEYLCLSKVSLLCSFICTDFFLGFRSNMLLPGRIKGVKQFFVVPHPQGSSHRPKSFFAEMCDNFQMTIG